MPWYSDQCIEGESFDIREFSQMLIHFERVSKAYEYSYVRVLDRARNEVMGRPQNEYY
jgi:hypothetical protein